MAQSYVPLSNQIDVDASGIARRLLWHPYSLGTIYLDQPDHHEPFEKPGVHLFWVISGRGTLDTQGNKYALNPGNSVWFIDMMHARTYTPQPGKRLTIRGIRFGGLNLENWHEQLGGSARAEFALDDPAEVRRGYREVWQILKRKPVGWEWQVHLILNRILGLLLASRSLFAPSHPELPAPVARVLKAVSANPFEDWKAKDLARVARVSYSSLRNLFSRAQRETLHHFLQRSRLDQARLLLADPGLTVKQVADRLHFSTEFYFSHFFKKWDGMSPTDFRKRFKRPPPVVTAPIADGAQTNLSHGDGAGSHTAESKG